MLALYSAGHQGYVETVHGSRGSLDNARRTHIELTARRGAGAVKANGRGAGARGVRIGIEPEPASRATSDALPRPDVRWNFSNNTAGRITEVQAIARIAATEIATGQGNTE